MADEENYVEIDLTEIPFCCPSCGWLTEYHPEVHMPQGIVPSHFHCMHCGVCLESETVGRLLTPALLSIHHQ